MEAVGELRFDRRGHTRYMTKADGVQADINVQEKPATTHWSPESRGAFITPRAWRVGTLPFWDMLE